MYDVWVNLQSEGTHETEATCAKRTKIRISLIRCLAAKSRTQFSCVYCVLSNVERIKLTSLQLCVSYGLVSLVSWRMETK